MHPAPTLETLQEKYSGFAAENLLKAFICDEFPGKIALVSSFGAEAALLLDMVAKIDPATAVIFLDTGKLFPETLEYKETLVRHLKLTNVQTYYPDYVDISRDDPDGALWKKNPNSCCYIRKVKPLNQALEGFDVWITGRKRFHGALRSNLSLLELFDGRIKVNPLVNWSVEEIKKAYGQRGLPAHPLIQEGYRSIGCACCTALSKDEDNSREGRWQGQDKTECGIHLDEDRRLQRQESK